ncbi:DUF6037 family protein [Pseudobutyrivibrio xylanivorans]|uniref:Uncharacterized protein n=1 Tax=Pseudobutyrivibrio xylanivorans TaxID=185007 RepID=A0A5P6VW80_PSEXY|nr:DUF6037 family protein [Pseudobutyrivibrio xylanivorans]QFJ56141.1 hypothetical protein FXF36_15255 [Pseudobutyrivibrio xylanivorans]
MSKLKFPNLKYLVPDMEKNKVEKEHFSFNYAKQKIDCVFCICNVHYELLVGVHMLNFGFVVNIEKNSAGEYVAEITDEQYVQFCRALNLSYKGDGFTSNKLLMLLAENTPSCSSGIRIDYGVMRDYIKCRHVDEAYKIYFKGWNDHTSDGNRAHNFDKTEFYFGKEVGDYCRIHNISSIWTDIPREETKYRNPW